MEQPVQTEMWKAQSLEELIRILHRIFAEDKVSVEEVQALMESYESNPEEWLQYAKFDQYRYKRSWSGIPRRGRRQGIDADTAAGATSTPHQPPLEPGRLLLRQRRGGRRAKGSSGTSAVPHSGAVWGRGAGGAAPANGGTGGHRQAPSRDPAEGGVRRSCPLGPRPGDS